MAHSVKGRLGQVAGIWELATVVQTNRRSSLSQTPFSLYYMLTSSRRVLDREEFTSHTFEYVADGTIVQQRYKITPCTHSSNKDLLRLLNVPCAKSTT